MALNPSSFKKDSFQSWLICVGRFFSVICTIGFQLSYGIIFSELLMEFQESRSKTALVGSLSMSLTFWLAPLSMSIGRRFGEVKVMFGGVVLVSASLLLSSIAKHIDQLIIFYGVFYGVGSSCISPLGQGLMTRAFDKHLGTAIGIGSAGVAIGTLSFTPILNALFTAVGWRTTFQILSGAIGFMLILAIAPFLLLGRSEDDTVQKNVSTAEVWQRLKLAIKSPSLLIFVAGMTIASFQYAISYTHQVQFAIESGVSKDEAANIPISMAVANAVGRIASGIVFDLHFMDPLYLFQIVLYSAAAISFLGSLAKTYVHFLVYFISFTLFEGASNAQCISIIRHLVGPDLAYEGFEVFLFWNSVSIVLGPYILGVIVDDTQDYSAIFYVTGTPLAIGATIFFFTRCIKSNSVYGRTGEVQLVEDSRTKRTMIVLDELDDRTCFIHRISVL